MIKNPEICSCHLVKRTEIRKAIQKNGAKTVSDIQVLTRAGTGCGRCKPVILDILKENEINQILAERQTRIVFPDMD